ncbi:MAG: competence/damage-inducible protein A [Phycisphaerae bacterium]|nr:competence/damage-inducible protein A [Phycisphaerae bacterium]
MRGATLSIGDELALGQIDDTNARWLAQRLAEEGIFRSEHRTVSDDVDAIARAMRELMASNDVLIVTGGLGPTRDDLTRDALNAVVDGNAEMVEDPQARVWLDRWFRGRGRAMPESNLVQALRPRSAQVIDNPNGTAPALAATWKGARVWCLPGPPREMQPLVERVVLPALRTLVGDRVMPTMAIHSFGLGESALAERLGDLMRREANPTVGTTASGSIVTARLRYDGPRGDAADRLEEIALQVEALWAPYAYGRDGRSLADVTLAELREREQTVAVAESCTGGLLGAMCTDVTGSSDVFVGGWIVYSNDLKERALRVPRSIIAAHGAVSEPVARELATAARTQARSTYGVGITGIAGPGGGSASKPVGTVFIGLATEEGARVRRFHFPGERSTVRDRAAKSALQWLRFAALGVPDTHMIWAHADPPGAERIPPSGGSA